MVPGTGGRPALRASVGGLLLGLLLTPALCTFAADASNPAEPSTVRLLLVPVQEATLSSPITARILSLPVDEGGRFHRGDRLVVFDCEIPRAELDKTRAELASAEKTHESNLQLQAMRSISNLEVAISAANLDKAKAEVAVTRARVRQCEIRAPFDGRVVEHLLNAHETAAQAEPLISILDDSRLETELIVPSAWVTWLKPGMPFEALIDETGRSYPARIKTIGARVDPASQSIKVTGEIEGSKDDLLAGMSGRAKLSPPPAPAE